MITRTPVSRFLNFYPTAKMVQFIIADAVATIITVAVAVVVAAVGVHFVKSHQKNVKARRTR